MDSGNVDFLNLQTVKMDNEETYARPFEWDDMNNPTKVVVMHTTCSKCSQRVVISEFEGNMIKLDDAYYTYCKNCEHGKAQFDNINKYVLGKYEETEEGLVEKFNFALLGHILNEEDLELTKELNVRV